MNLLGRNGVHVALVLHCIVSALDSNASSAAISTYNASAGGEYMPMNDSVPSPAKIMLHDLGADAAPRAADRKESPLSNRALEREIHDLRRELDELKHEKQQEIAAVVPMKRNPFLRVRDMLDPFARVQRAYDQYRWRRRKPNNPDLEHEHVDDNEDQDPLSGGLGDDPSASTDYEPVTWGFYPPFPMMVALPLITLIGVICFCGVMNPSWDPPATPPTRVGMPAWTTKTDAIFATCDRDRDGFLSYNDMRWMARVTNPDGAGHFTFEWYKDLCRPLGVDPRRGFDREEFRQSLMLLGNDVDSDADAVARAGSPPAQAGSSTSMEQPQA